MVEGADLFPTMIQEQHRTVNVLRDWPHDGVRLALQFFELYNIGRREVHRRELAFTRGLLQIDQEGLLWARHVTNASTVARVDLLTRIEEQFYNVERALTSNDAEQVALRLPERGRMYAAN